MNILDEIVANKRTEISQHFDNIPLSNAGRQKVDTRKPLDFKSALVNDGLSIISEVKKASPSKGLIREDFNPVRIASSYEANGTNCISVLTEQTYFQGHIEFLKSIRNSVGKPLLRKDFIIDARQIRESYLAGADAILLIVSILKSEELKQFLTLASEFEMACLVEVHSEEELETALTTDASLIGVNNRDLTTFKTNIEHSIKIRQLMPKGIIKVSESGIHTADDCRILFENGFNAVLVGEILMRQNDPGAYIKSLLNFNR